MAIQKRPALYQLRDTVTQSSVGAYTESTITTNLPLSERLGMIIKEVEFEFIDFDTDSNNTQSLQLLCESQTEEIYIDDESLIAKAAIRTEVSGTATNFAFQPTLFKQTFVYGITVAQKELYFGIDTPEDPAKGGVKTGKIRISYELIKLSDAQLIALATRC